MEALSQFTDDQMEAELLRRAEESQKSAGKKNEAAQKAASKLIALKMKQRSKLLDECKELANENSVNFEVPDAEDEYGDAKTWDGSARDWYNSNC